jgi:integrase/recombinase XerD
VARGESPVHPQVERFLEMLAAERNAAANTRLAYARDLADFAAVLRRSGTDIAHAGADQVRA